nr:MFS transporter [Dongshaea marina]
MAKNKNVLWIIFAMAMLGPLGIDLYLPSLPQMTQDFLATETQLQWSISLFLFFSGVSQLIAGPFSDRFGRRNSALLGCALFLGGSVLAMLTSSVLLLNIGRIIQGLGAASCAVTSLAWIRDHCTAEQSARFNNYIGGMIGLVPTFAPVLGGLFPSIGDGAPTFC